MKLRYGIEFETQNDQDSIPKIERLGSSTLSFPL